MIRSGNGHRDRVTVYIYTQGTHSYTSHAEYPITIRGIIVGWRFGEKDSDVDRSGGCRNNLQNIAQWGCLRLDNKGAYFGRCEKFRCNAKDAPDLKDTTNLASMFFRASFFTSDLSAWQTGQVTNMSEMFLIWRMLIRRGCLLLTLKWSDFCLHTLLRVTENAFNAYFSPFFPLGLRLHSNF
jgi:surface protein